MSNPVQLRRKATASLVAVTAVVFGAVLIKSLPGQATPTERPRAAAAATNASPSEPAVALTPSQLDAVKVEPVVTRPFSVEKEAVGNIDYDQDRSVQVFSPYQGKIISALANLGDDVKKGEPLYTIDSPDLIQAESTLIGAAASFALTGKELARVKDLCGTNGVSQRELEQATSDHQTAEGALKAAQDAMRLFGKTEADIEQIAATRKIDPALVVRSPVTGQVTARNAQPGLLVQPGSTPAPYAVADLSTKWMVAYVTESDSPLFHLGQGVRARVMAFPGRVFEGKISTMGPAVDPNTRRVMVRCELADPEQELRPGMLASFVIQVQAPVESAALPMNGVVRNGDGTMAAWVTRDRHQFFQRLVKLGLEQNGQYQVLEGLRPGELAVTDGAVFLSNMLEAPPTD